MNILIPNATGPTNIGDQAILTPLIEVLKKVYPKSNLVIHSSEPGRYKTGIADKLDHTLYAWSVFENKTVFIRFYRVTILMIVLLLQKLSIDFIPNQSLNALVGDYKKADLIVFVGGGYLRSQKGLTQTLNLLMIYFLFQFAKLSNARKIIAPMSFGPFAYTWQERLCANGLKGFDMVALREQFSFNTLNRYKIKNLIKSVDTAILLKLERSKGQNKKIILGFTIRKWLAQKEQTHFENEFMNAIIQFVKETGATIQPIVQVDAPQYGDVDLAITSDIAQKLRRSNVNTLPTQKVTSLKSASQIYSNLSLLLGMRMHSNILAALKGTPFVAISYEHKTDGIARDLGLGKYCIGILDAEQPLIYAKLIDAFRKRTLISKQLLQTVEKIAVKEQKFWQNTFKYIN